MTSDYLHLQAIARTYLQARHAFLTQSEQYPELAGNDSIIGRVGEMLAVEFLRLHGRQVEKHIAKNHAVSDLLVTEPNGEQKTVSVKLISAENRSGSTTRLKYGWDEFILVELDATYQVQRLGWLTLDDLRNKQHEHLVQKPPITSRRMLNATGLIGKYGKVYSCQNAADAPLLKSLL
jgi:hypothetical protein